MNKDQIKTALRQTAEAQYHDRLKSIDAEVDERFAQLQVELAVIDEAERRSQFMYSTMRNAAAERHGLAVAQIAPPATYAVVDDPRTNP